MPAPTLRNPIHRFDVEHFHRMIDASCFTPGDRVELLDGELRDMTPIGPAHGGTTDHLAMTLVPKLAGQAIVRVQGALVLDQATELYPDLTVLRRRADFYRRSHPTGDDVLLVIEVADTSLPLDQGPKLAKYAAAGIGRYWIVDLTQRALHDYRDPDRSQQRYRQLHSLTSGTLTLELAGVPVSVLLADLFPQ